MAKYRDWKGEGIFKGNSRQNTREKRRQKRIGEQINAHIGRGNEPLLKLYTPMVFHPIHQQVISIINLRS